MRKESQSAVVSALDRMRDALGIGLFRRLNFSILSRETDPSPSMRWPRWSSTVSDDEKEKVKWTDTLNATDWSHYTDPRNIIPVALLTVTCLVSVHVYRSHLRRIPQAVSIQSSFWRRRSLFGHVTSVGDGDNFRIFHTPGGRLAGWGWLPWRRVPTKREALKDKTVHLRLAGIDAPEMAHFGRPSQPYSQEAFDWLTAYVLHRRIRAYVYKRDQYDRAVATVYVRKWLLRRDVGLQMLRKGLATIYEAKTGAEFGHLEDKYRKAERWAKLKRKGMWAEKKQEYESPGQYKARVKATEEVHNK